jgi:hypothetical protein
MTQRFSAARALVLAAWLLSGCTLPGLAEPTPFAFPTPNLTHTALFQPAPSETPEPAALPTATPEVEPSPTSPAAPSDPTATFAPLTSRPNGSPVTAAFRSSPPTIDGDLAEWTTASYAVDQIVFGAANWTGVADLSGSFHIGWDEANLYVGVRVRDDRHVQISTGRFLYRGDAVEIQLDADLPGDYHVAALNADDYQLGLSPGNFGSLPPEAYLWYPAALEGARPGVTVGARQASDGYTLEARIPWSVFGVTPAAGKTFGFALSLSDNDQAGSALQQSMVSSVATRRLTNPATWGTLVLGGP